MWFASLTHADQMTYQPGPEGTDVWITNTYDYGSDYGVDNDKLEAGGWGDEYRFLWKPDFTGFPQNATSAALWMFPYPRGDASTPVSMAVDLMTTPWNEDTGWYNTVMNGIPVGVLSAPTPGQWYGINITQIYNLWKAGTYANHGFRFRPTGINNQFSQFLSSDFWYGPYRPKVVVTYKGADLQFPLAKPRPAGFIGPIIPVFLSPYAAQINSVLDHSLTTEAYCKDDVIVAYTGERAEEKYGTSGWIGTPSSTRCSGKTLNGYRQDTVGTPFVVNGNYGGGAFLFYDGHDGYDFQAENGTDVHAAADGKVYNSNAVGEENVRIEHPSGYVTQYWHMPKRYVVEGQLVSKGQKIGIVGKGHLHFTVKKGKLSEPAKLQLVDPYGWKGEYGTDPLKVDGKDNACLWAVCQ